MRLLVAASPTFHNEITCARDPANTQPRLMP